MSRRILTLCIFRPGESLVFFYFVTQFSDRSDARTFDNVLRLRAGRENNVPIGCSQTSTDVKQLSRHKTCRIQTNGLGPADLFHGQLDCQQKFVKRWGHTARERAALTHISYHGSRPTTGRKEPTMNYKQLLRRLWHWIQPGKHCSAFCPTCEFFPDCEYDTKHQGEEYRCEICLIQDVCPAFATGVLYPCPDFEEDPKWTD